MARNMTAQHLIAAGSVSKYEPQRQNHFLLQITGLPGGPEIIKLALVSCPFPKVSTEPLEIDWMNDKIKYAGKTTYDDINFSVIDYVDVGVARAIYNWHGQVYDPETGTISASSTYKKEAALYLIHPNGNSERTWTLRGVWPNHIDFGEGDMASADKVVISCTLSVDKAIWRSGD